MLFELPVCVSMTDNFAVHTQKGFMWVIQINILINQFVLGHKAVYPI